VPPGTAPSWSRRRRSARPHRGAGSGPRPASPRWPAHLPPACGSR